MLFGVIMGLAASASWAGANVFVARSSRAVGPFRALVWAQLVGALALAPVALLLDQRSVAIDGALFAWSALGGVAAVLAYACLFLSLERGQLSVVVPIMSSWSVIAAAMSIGLLGESLQHKHLIGAALVVVGILLVSRFSQAPAASASSSSSSTSPGDASQDARTSASQGAHTKVAAVGNGRDGDGRTRRLALLSAVGGAVGFGLLIPSMDQMAPYVGRLGAIPLVFLIDLALGAPLALFWRVDLGVPPRRAWPAIAAAGLFETIGFVWISLGTSRAPVAIVSPLAGLASAFTVLYAWAILRERPAPLVLLGAAIACGGVVTLAL